MSQSHLRLMLSLCVALSLSPAVRAADWPQFRGPNSLGVSQARDLPVTWSETENVAWKTALPGYGSSSPIALDGTLYVTCYSGYGIEGREGALEDLTLHVVSVDGKTGKILWDKKINPALPESKKVRDHGYAAATPATDGKHLYVFFGKTGVFKFDLDGRQIWHTSVGTKTHEWGSGTSPVLYEDLVIVNASVESGSLVALNKETGKEVWRAGGMDSSWNTPHLIRDGRRSGRTGRHRARLDSGFRSEDGQGAMALRSDSRLHLPEHRIAQRHRLCHRRAVVKGGRRPKRRPGQCHRHAQALAGRRGSQRLLTRDP